MYSIEFHKQFLPVGVGRVGRRRDRRKTHCSPSVSPCLSLRCESALLGICFPCSLHRKNALLRGKRYTAPFNVALNVSSIKETELFQAGNFQGQFCLYMCFALSTKFGTCLPCHLRSNSTVFSAF